MDHRPPPKDGHAIPGQTVARRQSPRSEISSYAVARKQGFPGARDHDDEHIVASASQARGPVVQPDDARCTAYVRHDGLFVTGRAAGNRVENVRAQTYYHDPDLREDYQ